MHGRLPFVVVVVFFNVHIVNSVGDSISDSYAVVSMEKTNTPPQRWWRKVVTHKGLSVGHAELVEVPSLNLVEPF